MAVKVDGEMQLDKSGLIPLVDDGLSHRVHVVLG